MADLTGHDFGRYHLTERLGEGGMATVYKAYDTRLETDVAVKVIRKENLAPSVYERSIKRFTREAKALARLTHLSIVKVTDFGEYDGKPYLVMEFLPGGTLKERLGKPIPWKEALRTLIPIARALDFAHRQNMIHRDVKPSNILITADGDPMLSDFGIAKILDVEETADLTGTGMGIGTPEYMAPEQWTGKTSTQSDEYALGVVLYEMLTGLKPYTADTPAAILLKQSNEPLPRPSQYTRDLPEKVEKLLLKAMAKNPVDRYASMGDLVNAMESLLAGTAAPVKEQPARSRGRAANTLTTVEEEPEEPTIRDLPPKELVAREYPEPREKSRIPWMVLGGVVLGLVVLSGILGWALGGGITLFPTRTPSATHTPIATSTPTITPTKIYTLTATQPSTEITDSKGVTMLLVPADEFTMGSENGYSNEKPVHQVYVDAFYMDIYEITNALYKACVDAGVCAPPNAISSYTHSSYYGNSQYSDYPVINVDWNQANTYCEWRGARLPTEAEWEKAACGTDGRTYPWGNSLDRTYANYGGYVGDTTEVGSYASGKSPYGIFDMAGNVWEWVADSYSDTYYSNSSSRNPVGPSSGNSRVLRGGSWSNNDNNTRTSYRFRYMPVNWNYYIGFRCVRSLP